MLVHKKLFKKIRNSDSESKCCGIKGLHLSSDFNWTYFNWLAELSDKKRNMCKQKLSNVTKLYIDPWNHVENIFYKYYKYKIHLINDPSTMKLTEKLLKMTKRKIMSKAK